MDLWIDWSVSSFYCISSIGDIVFRGNGWDEGRNFLVGFPSEDSMGGTRVG